MISIIVIIRAPRPTCQLNISAFATADHVVSAAKVGALAGKVSTQLSQ